MQTHIPMKSPFLLRISALLLALSLALPNPGYALRGQNAEVPATVALLKSGLEENVSSLKLIPTLWEAIDFVSDEKIETISELAKLPRYAILEYRSIGPKALKVLDRELAGKGYIPAWEVPQDLDQTQDLMEALRASHPSDPVYFERHAAQIKTALGKMGNPRTLADLLQIPPPAIEGSLLVQMKNPRMFKRIRSLLEKLGIKPVWNLAETSAGAEELVNALMEFRRLADEIRNRVDKKEKFGVALRQALASYAGSPQQRLVGPPQVTAEDLLYVILGERDLAGSGDAELSKKFILSGSENLTVLPAVVGTVVDAVRNTGNLPAAAGGIIVDLDMKGRAPQMTEPELRRLVNRVLETARTWAAGAEEKDKVLDVLLEFRHWAMEIRAKVQDENEPFSKAVSDALAEYTQSVAYGVLGLPKLSRQDLLYVMMGQREFSGDESALSKAFQESAFAPESLGVLPAMITVVYGMTNVSGQLPKAPSAVLLRMDFNRDPTALPPAEQLALISRVLEVARTAAAGAEEVLRAEVQGFLNKKFQLHNLSEEVLDALVERPDDAASILKPVLDALTDRRRKKIEPQIPRMIPELKRVIAQAREKASLAEWKVRQREKAWDRTEGLAAVRAFISRDMTDVAQLQKAPSAIPSYREPWAKTVRSFAETLKLPEEGSLDPRAMLQFIRWMNLNWFVPRGLFLFLRTEEIPETADDLARILVMGEIEQQRLYEWKGKRIPVFFIRSLDLKPGDENRDVHGGFQDRTIYLRTDLAKVKAGTLQTIAANSENMLRQPDEVLMREGFRPDVFRRSVKATVALRNRMGERWDNLADFSVENALHEELRHWMSHLSAEEAAQRLYIGLDEPFFESYVGHTWQAGTLRKLWDEWKAAPGRWVDDRMRLGLVLYETEGALARGSQSPEDFAKLLLGWNDEFVNLDTQNSGVYEVSHGVGIRLLADKMNMTHPEERLSADTLEAMEAERLTELVEGFWGRFDEAYETLHQLFPPEHLAVPLTVLPQRVDRAAGAEETRLASVGHVFAEEFYARPETAASYDQAWDSPLTHEIHAELIAQLGDLTGQTIVELAAGTGIGTRMLAEAVGPAGKVIALERSPAMIALARQRVAGLPHVELRQTGDLTLASGDFSQADGIIALNAVHVFDDLPSLVEQWFRALKPGAWLAFNTSNFLDDSPAKFSRKRFVSEVTRRVQEMIRQRNPDWAPPFQMPILSGSIADLITGAGFSGVKTHTREWKTSNEEQLRKLQVAGIFEILFPETGFSASEQQQMLAEAVAKTGEPGPLSWFYLTARKPAAGAEESAEQMVVRLGQSSEPITIEQVEQLRLKILEEAGEGKSTRYVEGGLDQLQDLVLWMSAPAGARIPKESGPDYASFDFKLMLEPFESGELDSKDPISHAALVPWLMNFAIFSGGNHRTGWALLNVLLLRAGVVQQPITWDGNRKGEYYAVLDELDLPKFVDLIKTYIPARAGAEEFGRVRLESVKPTGQAHILYHEASLAALFFLQVPEDVLSPNIAVVDPARLETLTAIAQSAGYNLKEIGDWIFRYVVLYDPQTPGDIARATKVAEGRIAQRLPDVRPVQIYTLPDALEEFGARLKAILDSFGLTFQSGTLDEGVISALHRAAQA